MPTICVCEAPPALDPDGPNWNELAARCREVSPDLFLLNELPFGRWIASGPEPRASEIATSQAAHTAGIGRLADFGAKAVLGSRAIVRDGRNVNEAFIWTVDDAATPVHTKQFFPDEPGYWEARWYQPGVRRFEIGRVDGLCIGFLLCTDVMFLEWARYYGRSGAHVIAVPRATPTGTVERWRTVMSAAAIVSGCYVASSNRVGVQEDMEFAGCGWIFHPSGDLMVETHASMPLATAEIDVADVLAAQRDYPCYVKDLQS